MHAIGIHIYIPFTTYLLLDTIERLEYFSSRVLGVLTVPCTDSWNINSLRKDRGRSSRDFPNKKLLF